MINSNYFHQESERFYFRKMDMTNKSAWSHFFINNDRLRFLAIDPESKSSEELAEIWIQRQLNRYEEFGLGQLAAFAKENNELIGVAGILPKTIEGALVHEVAYSLLPKHWGKGYATEMAQQMKQFGFQQLKLKSMISIIHIENTDSAKVAIKNGMTIWKNTTYLDMDVHIYKIKSPIYYK